MKQLMVLLINYYGNERKIRQKVKVAKKVVPL